MNTLSWMIYAAEISGGVKSATSAALVAIGFCSALAVLMCPLIVDMLDIRDDPRPYVIGSLKKVGAVMALLTIAYVFTPSPTTIYMIAASEAGEQIATSPDSIEIMGDLKTIIKKRLKDELGAE